MAAKARQNDGPPSSYHIGGTTYEVHPAALLFPLPEEDSPRFLEMVADIRENGPLVPVYVRGRVLADGRTRARAAEVAGCEIQVEEIPEGMSISAFVTSVNLHRRNLNEDQRAGIAAALVDLRKQERREAQGLDRHLRRGRAATRAADAAEPAAEEKDTGSSAASGGSAESGAGATPESAGDGVGGPASAPGAEASAGAAGRAKSGEAASEPLEALTLGQAAADLNVSPKLVKRASAVIHKDPSFRVPISNGIIKVVDAERLLKQPEDVRAKVLELLSAPGASLSFRDACDRALGREPSGKSRAPKGPRRTAPAVASGSSGAGSGVSGLPALPALPGEDGAEDGAAGAAEPASASPAPAEPAQGETGPESSSGPPAPPASERPPVPVPVHFAPGHDAPTPHLQSPADVVDGVRLLFGKIDLDVCSSAEEQARVGALRWFTTEADPFQEPWQGLIYVFPPLEADTVQRFASRALTEIEASRAQAVAFFGPLDLRDRWAVDFVSHRSFRGVVVSRDSPEFPVPGGEPWRPGYPFALYLLGGGFELGRAVEAFAHWGEVLAIRRG